MTVGLRSGGGRAAATGLLAAALLLGCGTAPAPTPASPRAQAPAQESAQASAQPGAEAPTQVADPVRLRIPAIGVHAAVRPLRVDRSGVLPPPPGDHIAGWWRAGPEPGEPGPAVLAGHVDSYRGPAVFFRLVDLRTGDRIHIDRADGSTVTFHVRRLERHDKGAFPTDAVYRPTPGAQLRLITCGGAFDDAARRYLDNVIVFATGR